MSPILTLKKSELPPGWIKDYSVIPDDNQLFNMLNRISHLWSDRKEAETNDSLKQLIPYILVEWKGMLGAYHRSGNEKRLDGRLSVGAGGHIELCDADPASSLSDIVAKGAIREIQEELGNIIKSPAELHFLGVINEEYSEVGKVHLGLVYLYRPVYKPVPATEIADLTWLSPQEINTREFELWSVMACELYNIFLKQENK